MIFGPPGSGKSTFIGEATELGFAAFDLEDCGKTREDRASYFNLNLPKWVGSEKVTFIGAADISPNEKMSDCIKVLLLPNRRDYLRRSRRRDRIVKAKAGQEKELLYETFKGNIGLFDIVHSDNSSPKRSFKKLLRELSK